MKDIECPEAEGEVDILLWSEWFHSFFTDLQRPIIDAFRSVSRTEEKALADYVGELDKSIERSLFNFLPRVFDCPVLSEETPSPWPPAFRKFWVIDPLDGTHNFLAGLPIFGTIVALIVGGKAVFSAIYLPMDEQSIGHGLYVAAKGQGAFKRLPGGGLEPIHVSGQDDLKKAFLLLEGPSKKLYTFHHIENAVFAVELAQNGLSFAYSLTRLAAGGCWTRGVDIIIANGKPCEVFAGKLLVEEAGGKTTDSLGNTLSFTNYGDSIYSNGLLHQKTLGSLFTTRL